MRSPWSLTLSPPWRDRRGRFLPFKSAVLASLFVPGALYAYWLATDQLGGRQVMELIFAPLALGYPSFMGPGVPADRIEIMRRAFDKTMQDPEFIGIMQQQNLVLDPAPGEAVQAIVERLYRMPQSAIERARAYIPPS